MLPSKGYFSAIPCVFYLAGNCERPHCHYRHCARDKTNSINDDLESPSDAVEERNWLGSNLSESFVTQMVEKAVDKVFVEDPKKAETLDRDHIIKTALDKLKEETLKAKINPNQKAHSSSIGVPSYKPTPIAELNKRHIPVMYAPERPLSAIRKEKGPDDKIQISISTLSSSSTVAADPFKHWVESEDSKCSLNSSVFLTPIQDSVIEENSLDAKDVCLHNTLSEMIDYQMERKDASSDGNNDVSNAYTFSSSKASFQIVTDQVDTVCDDVFSELGINGMLTEQHDIEKELPLDSDNGLLTEKTYIGRTLESADLIGSTNSHTLKMIDVKDDKNDVVCGVTKNDLSGYKMVLSSSSNEQIADVEKRTSHKHGSKSHSSKKSEGAKSSDKHRSKKSSDTTSNNKHERRSSTSSKVKHRSKDKEKNEDQNGKTKCRTKSEAEKSLPLPSSKKSPSRDDCSKVKRVEKGSERHSKINEKSDRKDKHNDKPKDEKRSHGSKSSCDEHRKKNSGIKHSSFKHSSDHHKDKSNVKSSNHTKTVSDLHRNDDVSKTKKRKHDDQLHRPDKRMKGLSKSTPDGNYIAAEVDIFADSKKGSTSLFTTSSAYKNDISDDAFDEPGSDEMDSIIYSPPTQEIDAISISSADSTVTTSNCKEGWVTVTSKKSKMKRRNSEESQSKSSLNLDIITSNKVDSAGTASDKKWTKAKEMIQKTHTPKIRIAHVPNVYNILSAKTRLLSNKAPQSTLSNTANKPSLETEDSPMPRVTKRVAHGGQAARFPPLIHSQDIKINASIRQHYCNTFYGELAKFLDVEEAMTKASTEEFEIAKKCSHPKIYKNNCSLLLLKIRRSQGILQKNEAPSEKLEPDSTPEYTYGWSLYRCFSKYLMSEEELIEHGYPMPLPGQSSCAYTEKSARRYCVQQPDKPFTRKCANCGKLYEIDEDGMPTTSNDCFYHWGRLRKIPGRVQAAEKFTCCDGADDATPCQASVYHVWSGRNEDCMPGFVRTREFPGNQDESSAGIFALDCEMCYTTRGLELARLTVVNVNGDMVFDEVVSLESPVLDYCTRFSGIDEDKIKLATYSFSDVQNWVLDNVYDKTILVGHSLENDLKVLKIIHKRIVDTSVTFPHKFGLPQKRSLKFLASSLLSTTIQENENGHDSKEDAITCLRLIMKKIKEDSKIRKPRVIIGFSGKKK